MDGTGGDASEGEGSSGAERTDGTEPPTGATRRRLLRSLGVAGAVAVAGCSQSAPGSPAGTPEPTATDTAGGTDTATPTGSPEPTETPADPTLLWVGPDGDDDASATEDDPLRTFDEAVNRRAAPGDTVRAKPGVYRQYLTMRQGGEPGAPITITGPPDAVLRPDPGAAQILRIHHSHVHLTGCPSTACSRPSDGSRRWTPGPPSVSTPARTRRSRRRRPTT